MFKIFINLQDVNEDEGPLHLVKKEKSKNLLNSKNFIAERNI